MIKVDTKVEVLGHNGEPTSFGIGRVEEICSLPNYNGPVLCIRVPGQWGRFLRTAQGVRVIRQRKQVGR